MSAQERPQLTTREQETLLSVMLSLKSTPEIDFAKLAEHCNMSNVNSARNAWYFLRKKLYPENSSTPKTPSPQTSNKRKRLVKEEGSDEDESQHPHSETPTKQNKKRRLYRDSPWPRTPVGIRQRRKERAESRKERPGSSSSDIHPFVVSNMTEPDPFVKQEPQVKLEPAEDEKDESASIHDSIRLSSHHAIADRKAAEMPEPSSPCPSTVSTASTHISEEEPQPPPAQPRSTSPSRSLPSKPPELSSRHWTKRARSAIRIVVETPIYVWTWIEVFLLLFTFVLVAFVGSFLSVKFLSSR